ncbi:MAG TPA: DUF3267 domain-containing protein [Candidatus Anaerobutyricum stercoripullorum]|uniref:DUF3267 domain-containing protein n=1 Tax=Candidatus Anaerobutyricum stercoripullorum TaxID=2838456 RepID=A0A9D1X5M7_9FIRM|nr:DUF3267 domain-containing protein [Candidatus Anaerobutyricum stercoripullorum]
MAKERKISPEKQRIAANYEAQKRQFFAEGYEEKEEVISILKANLMAFVTAGPIAILEIAVWILVGIPEKGLLSLNSASWFWVFFIASIFIHELLHGVGWSIFTKGKWKSIHIGMMWKTLTPYCHCKEPLKPREYLVGAAMPFLVLGIGLFAAALAAGSSLLFLLSIVNVLCAGGDTTLICMLFSYLNRKDNCYILDHPTKCGFVTFSKSS